MNSRDRISAYLRALGLLVSRYRATGGCCRYSSASSPWRRGLSQSCGAAISGGSQPKIGGYCVAAKTLSRSVLNRPHPCSSRWSE